MRVIKINSREPEKSKIKKAATLIKKGEVVAFPTETVYGLGANAFDEEAVKKIFILKGRPQDNPLIVHVSSLKQLKLVAGEIPSKAKILMRKFWPGPLTIILNKKESVPEIVTAGLQTVAVRMPSNKIALELIKQTGPIAAPSANISGKPSATTAEHVKEDFKEKIKIILDGGKTQIGLESSVIDLTTKNPVLLRPGKITKEEIEKAIGKIKIAKTSKKPKSPGMKYKHYSPSVPVILTTNPKLEIEKHKKGGKKVAAICFAKCGADEEYNPKDLEDYAKNLFYLFRKFEKKNDAIIVEKVSEKGIGRAILNRIKKACGIK